MRSLNNIDIQRSINEERLIFQEEWRDKFDRVILYITFIASIMIVSSIIHVIKPVNQYDRLLLIIIFSLIVLFFLYIIYRKSTEKNLLKVISLSDQQKNMQLILDFANKKHFEVYVKCNDYLIFNESNHFNPRYKKTMILIFKDNIVLFTILQDKLKLNVPTLFSHWWLKYDLKKLLNNIK